MSRLDALLILLLAVTLGMVCGTAAGALIHYVAEV